MAMQVVTRLRDAFGIDLPVRALFEAPTVAALALRITQQTLQQLDPAMLLRELEAVEQSTGVAARKPTVKGTN